jgi:hypothetical protein
MTGILSWMSATSSLESVVLMANLRIHSPEAGSFQFSQIPPSALDARLRPCLMSFQGSRSQCKSKIKNRRWIAAWLSSGSQLTMLQIIGLLVLPRVPAFAG